ncbi:thioredoxin domain-containing protein [Candidatus Pacearchaeota archaeon]|nr:MAG: hypothetical protein QJ16_C0006G0007 [archaeon GW2011_AR1]MBS3078000.1 thioredoxin domain-containing protein [Candidatus Pacearchaeota archaeon]HIH52211.1 thioredoxin domain-containing protein [Nanoarchaeota archaeon]
MGDKIEIKKDTFFKGTIAILAILLIISIFTGGFGFGANPKEVITDEGGNTAQPVNMNVLEDPSLFPVIGSNNAKHTVVEFSDFQCPYCAIASGLPNWATQYESQYSDLFGVAGKIQEMTSNGNVKMIYVPMSFLGQESVDAAQAALCANKQGKFWEMHDAIFNAHDGTENKGVFTRTKLKTLAKGITGLDTTKFNTCLDNDETLKDVQKVASIASQFTKGTPTFYVDGEKASASWSQISALLN